MLSPPQIRRRLSEAVAAALRGDPVSMGATETWLTSVTARELLRIDHYARKSRHTHPMPGHRRQWTRRRLAKSPAVVAALAAMHHDGYVRERAVRSLATSLDPLSDRALAVRLTDHIRVIREEAARAVLRRTTLEHADRLMPLLHRFRGRHRGPDVLSLYLETLIADHGEDLVWARLRGSGDHDLRRAAFRHSLDPGLLGTRDAILLFPKERDQVVRRLLIRVIADSAPSDVITRVLLRGRTAEGRALGLAKLTATEIDPADLERLLVDSSPLVRFWARRHWQEVGRDPAAAYAAVARSNAKPAVRARAYTGLAETGTVIERQEILDLVRSAELPLLKAGLSLLQGSAAAADMPMLFALVAGEQSRVARLAAEVLTENPRLWTPADLGPFKNAERPELRRRAWWIHRQRGGWEAVIADLELLHDPDPQLSGAARQPVPPMYGLPTEAQRERIAALLADAPLSRSLLLSVAVAAGLPDLARSSARLR